MKVSVLIAKEHTLCATTQTWKESFFIFPKSGYIQLAIFKFKVWLFTDQRESVQLRRLVANFLFYLIIAFKVG